MIEGNGEKSIPELYHVATPKNARKISDERVKQIYENSEAFDMGKTTINYDGVDIAVITEYAYELPKTNMVMEVLRREVL